MQLHQAAICSRLINTLGKERMKREGKRWEVWYKANVHVTEYMYKAMQGRVRREGEGCIRVKKERLKRSI